MGRQIPYVQCPMCGSSRPCDEDGKPIMVHPFSSDMTLVSVRESGGKAEGFRVVSSAKFKDIAAYPQYRGLITAMRKKLEAILVALPY